MLAAGAIVVGLVAILGAALTVVMFYVAYRLGNVLGEALAELAANIPLWGGTIADGIRAATQWLASGIFSVLNSLVGDAESVWNGAIDAIVNNHRASNYSVRQTQADTILQLNTLSGQATGGINQAVAGYVVEAINAVDNRMDQEAVQTYDSAVGYTQEAYDSLGQWANSAIQSVYQDVVTADQAVNAAVQYTTDTADQLRTTLTNQIFAQGMQSVSDAETFTTNAIGVVNSNIGYVSDQVNGRITQERSLTDAELGNVTQVINAVETNISA